MAAGQGNEHGQHAYSGDEGLVINTRLLALEREQREERQRERKQTQWLVISTALLALFTLFLFIGSAVSNSLMIRQLNDSRKSTDAATRSALAAEKSLLLSKQSTEAIIGQNQEALEKTLGQNERALKVTLDQQQKQLTATLGIFAFDQRPWLTVDRFNLSAEPEEGRKLSVTAWYRNAGKTPALNVVPLIQLYLYDLKTEPPNKYDAPPDMVFRFVTVLPGTNTQSFSSVEWEVPSKDLPGYKAKTNALYVRAMMYYWDSNNTRLSTEVCVYHISGEPLDFVHYCQCGVIMH